MALSTPVSSAVAGAPLDLAFDAIGEAATIAECYARTAGEFAAIGDGRGVRYALRQAAVAIAAAADAAATLRPSTDGGGQ